MKALLKLELGHYFRRPGFYAILLLVLVLGIFTGSNFSLSLSPDILKNASYTVAHMVGFLSLLALLFTTIFATQIVFREKESNFNLILFALPIAKQNYFSAKFTTLFTVSFFCYALVVAGFWMGQLLKSDGAYGIFQFGYYFMPLLVFGFANTFFCASVLCCVGWLSRNKFMVYVSGLFLYILYMVMLIFSGSPMMAKSMPQSEAVLRWSAALDPFGLSGFFLQTSIWTIEQRNTALLFPSGLFLANRLGILLLSGLLLLIAFRKFSFATGERAKRKMTIAVENSVKNRPYKPVSTSQNWKSGLASLLSFAKIDLKYTVRSIPFALIALGLLFCASMEIYGAIEKGIRIPQQYAGSGLMAKTIIDTFHGLCLIVVLFYAHEIFWRSRNSNFSLIEQATPASATSWFFSKWLTLSIIILLFGSLMVLLGMAFQFAYGYPEINWHAYFGVYWFNCLPLITSAGLMLILQKIAPNKYVGLALTAVIVIFTATSLGKVILNHPLLRFQMPFKGLYSDMNGYGMYFAAYGWRIVFGFCLIATAMVLVAKLRKLRLNLKTILLCSILCSTGYFAARNILKDYKPKSQEAEILAQVIYEKNYRKFQNLLQPTITDIITEVHLFPKKNAYDVSGKYTLQNKTNKPIDQILVNFSDGIAIKKASLMLNNKHFDVENQYEIITLPYPLQPNEKAAFEFAFSYHWTPVNGHESFNVIVENGTFLRISRYFPQFGYDAENELADEKQRTKFGLQNATPLTTIDAPVKPENDFIRLKMTVSTEKGQTAIGVGELTKKWERGNRSYFRYETSPIPFRFAVSSAVYAVQTAHQNGKKIEVYFHPSHRENVAQLIENAKQTMAYCEAHFGKYPFQTIRFAEVSGFTRGFAATAYPASIFMTEDMIFHANINADKQQDVINELAGHELSHLWWGNSQMAPDSREGAAMLTETLAMYTELMLVKKSHGKKRVLENVNMHLGIYLGERGFTEEHSLCKVQGDDSHISYSKGLVVMYQLAEMLGEEKINTALKNLLKHHAYPNPPAVSTDFLNELYLVSDQKAHAKIDDWFRKITTYSFKVKAARSFKKRNQSETILTAEASKFYEDGKGKKIRAKWNDTVTVALVFENGNERRFTIPIVNNQLNWSVKTNEKPHEIIIDPDELFIKTDPESTYTLL